MGVRVIGDVSLDLLSGNPCLVQVGLVPNDGLVLAVPVCQYITTYLPTTINGTGAQPLLSAARWFDINDVARIERLYDTPGSRRESRECLPRRWVKLQ